MEPWQPDPSGHKAVCNVMSCCMYLMFECGGLNDSGVMLALLNAVSENIKFPIKHLKRRFFFPTKNH